MEGKEEEIKVIVRENLRKMLKIVQINIMCREINTVWLNK